jgi:hypothetical protein
MKKNGTSASPAMALANKVLPVPGGPTNKTPGLPDINGRDAILKVHMQKLPIAKNVKSINIAKGTPGFSGADLANLRPCLHLVDDPLHQFHQ